MPYPLIVCPLLPSKRTRHTPSFERKKKCQHDENGKILSPPKQVWNEPTPPRITAKIRWACVDRHRHSGAFLHRPLGRADCHLGAVRRRVSYSSNAPNRIPPSVLPDPMDLHCRCIGLDCLPTAVLRRSHSNDRERINPIPLPVTFHRAAQAPRDVVNAVLSALCRGIDRTRCTHLGCLCRPIPTSG